MSLLYNDGLMEITEVCLVPTWLGKVYIKVLEYMFSQEFIHLNMFTTCIKSKIKNVWI